MKPDNPGVRVPPPLIYAAIFTIAILIQKRMPIDDSFLKKPPLHFISFFLLILAIFFISRSLFQFSRTKNTIITVKTANSLQTTGIYSKTRNPMYVGLLMVYLGLACMVGNWWNFILIPLLLLIIQEYVIKKEEQYLFRTFGENFIHYKQNVRRWL
jgi:protein-S-isoprenylcysteine O-methyltransferase Ste14